MSKPDVHSTYYLSDSGASAYSALTRSRQVTLNIFWNEMGNYSIKKAVGDFTNKAVLDAGCGSGRMIEKYYQWGANQVTGVDISEPMITIAKNNNRAQTEFYVEDLCHLEQIGQFDVAVSCLALMYLDSFDKFDQAIKAIYANLTPGGVFASWMACYHDRLPMEGHVPATVSVDTKWSRESKEEFQKVTVYIQDVDSPVIKMEIFNLSPDTVKRVMLEAGFVNISASLLQASPIAQQIVDMKEFRNYLNFMWIFRGEKPLYIERD